eukprot:jgi/Ulvmu1/12003/UM083_0016.1
MPVGILLGLGVARLYIQCQHVRCPLRMAVRLGVCYSALLDAVEDELHERQPSAALAGALGNLQCPDLALLGNARLGGADVPSVQSRLANHATDTPCGTPCAHGAYCSGEAEGNDILSCKAVVMERCRNGHVQLTEPPNTDAMFAARHAFKRERIKAYLALKALTPASCCHGSDESIRRTDRKTTACPVMAAAQSAQNLNIGPRHCLRDMSAKYPGKPGAESRHRPHEEPDSVLAMTFNIPVEPAAMYQDSNAGETADNSTDATDGQCIHRGTLNAASQVNIGKGCCFNTGDQDACCAGTLTCISAGPELAVSSDPAQDADARAATDAAPTLCCALVQPCIQRKAQAHMAAISINHKADGSSHSGHGDGNVGAVASDLCAHKASAAMRRTYAQQAVEAALLPPDTSHLDQFSPRDSTLVLEDSFRHCNGGYHNSDGAQQRRSRPGMTAMSAQVCTIFSTLPDEVRVKLQVPAVIVSFGSKDMVVNPASAQVLPPPMSH